MLCLAWRPKGAVLTDHSLRRRDQGTGSLETWNGFTSNAPSRAPQGLLRALFGRGLALPALPSVVPIPS